MINRILQFIKSPQTKYLFMICTTIIFWLTLMSCFTGLGPLTHNTYNSYSLQADSWRNGRLDLGVNYTHLELAIYKGKYYVSFPPFPSYIAFPLTFIWGSNTPDGIILWIIDIILSIYLFKLAYIITKDNNSSALISIFFMLGTNIAFIIVTPWVWFWAQTLCVLLSIMSIYYAIKGKGALSFGLWACSVGCRPMQALFFPILLALLLYYKKADDNEKSYFDIIKSHVTWYIPPFIIGLSYMILNYARFDNPLEFGHNYLPEFTEAEYGQFNLHYLKNNFQMLLNFPDFDDNNRLVVDHFGNLNFIIVSPIIIIALISIIQFIIQKNKKYIILSLSIVIFSILYLIITMMHRTMGGWHFGNRYTNDILPYMFLLSTLGIKKNKNLNKLILPLLVFGLCLNAIGNVIVYNGL